MRTVYCSSGKQYVHAVQLTPSPNHPGRHSHCRSGPPPVVALRSMPWMGSQTLLRWQRRSTIGVGRAAWYSCCGLQVVSSAQCRSRRFVGSTTENCVSSEQFVHERQMRSVKLVGATISNELSTSPHSRHGVQLVRPLAVGTFKSPKKPTSQAQLRSKSRPPGVASYEFAGHTVHSTQSSPSLPPVGDQKPVKHTHSRSSVAVPLSEGYAWLPHCSHSVQCVPLPQYPGVHSHCTSASEVPLCIVVARAWQTDHGAHSRLRVCDGVVDSHVPLAHGCATGVQSRPSP